MTKSRDLKLLIRERMEKTGESYMTARRHVEKMSSGAKQNVPASAATGESASENVPPTAQPGETAKENGPQASVMDEIKGWRRVSEKGMPEDYEIRVDHTQRYRSSSSALIRSRRDTAVGSATRLMQCFLADQYRGCRLRFSAWIKSEGLTGSCRLWMRIDEDIKLLVFATSQPVTDTADWVRREVVLDVDQNANQEATMISIAVLLDGAGAAWVADIEIEKVGKDVPTTAGRDHLGFEPRNLNFLE